MRMFYKKFFVALLAAGTLAAAGCSSEDDPPPTASIGAGGQSSGASDGTGHAAPPDFGPRELNLPADRYDHEPPPSEPSPPPISDPHPLVVLKTSFGDVTLKLDRGAAPITVDNFLVYVADRFYENTMFHQVEDGFLLAAGGYTADGKLKPARTPIRNEAHNGRTNLRGTVAMVRHLGIDSATSQFLINLQDNPQLDHKSRELPVAGERDEYGYCVFGEVVAGWEVVERIAKARVQRSGQFASLPVQPVSILSATALGENASAQSARR